MPGKYGKYFLENEIGLKSFCGSYCFVENYDLQIRLVCFFSPRFNAFILLTKKPFRAVWNND